MKVEIKTSDLESTMSSYGYDKKLYEKSKDRFYGHMVEFKDALQKAIDERHITLKQGDNFIEIGWNSHIVVNVVNGKIQLIDQIQVVKLGEILIDVEEGVEDEK